MAFFLYEGGCSKWELGSCDLFSPVFPMNWELWRRACGEEEMCLSLSGRRERACLFFAKHLPF